MKKFYTKRQILSIIKKPRAFLTEPARDKLLMPDSIGKQRKHLFNENTAIAIALASELQDIGFEYREAWDLAFGKKKIKSKFLMVFADVSGLAKAVSKECLKIDKQKLLSKKK